MRGRIQASHVEAVSLLVSESALTHFSLAILQSRCGFQMKPNVSWGSSFDNDFRRMRDAVFGVDFRVN